MIASTLPQMKATENKMAFCCSGNNQAFYPILVHCQPILPFLPVLDGYKRFSFYGFSGKYFVNT